MDRAKSIGRFPTMAFLQLAASTLSLFECIVYRWASKRVKSCDHGVVSRRVIAA